MEESHQEATEKEVERILGLFANILWKIVNLDTKLKMEQSVFVS